MRRDVMVALAAFAAAAGLTGCGRTASPSGPSTTTTLAITQAAAASAAVTSARVTGHLTTTLTNYTAPGSRTPVTSSFSADLSGAFAVHPLRGQFQLNNLAVGQQSLPTSIGALYTARAFYLHLGIPPLNGKWLELPYSSLHALGNLNVGQLTQTTQQLTPGQYLQFLRRAGRIVRVGTQTVDGVATVHYAGTVDPSAVFQRLAPGLRTAVDRQLAAAGVHTEHIDVWIGTDNLPRRIAVSATGAHLSLSMRIDYLDYDVPVQISPPPGADTLNLADLSGGLTPST